MQRCELLVKAKREYNGCCHVCDASQQLSFTVLGSAGEKVPVTLVAPQGEGEGADAGGALAGTIVVVDVVVGAGGETKVKCTAATGCAQS